MKTKIIKIKKIRKVGVDINNWDILDGRKKYGKPFKKFAKVLDFTAYLISCATISLIIVYFLIQWMA